jgi:hypothetical protein
MLINGSTDVGGNTTFCCSLVFCENGGKYYDAVLPKCTFATHGASILSRIQLTGQRKRVDRNISIFTEYIMNRTSWKKGRYLEIRRCLSEYNQR